MQLPLGRTKLPVFMSALKITFQGSRIGSQAWIRLL